MGEAGMRRREFVMRVGGVALAWPITVLAQQAKVWRVGVLTTGTSTDRADLLKAFSDHLKQQALSEGRQIELVVRYAGGQPQALESLAREIAARRPAVVIAPGAAVVEAVRKAAPEVPIVTLVGDITSAGLAASLAKPGSNVTGVSFLANSLDAKRLELLAELVPKRSAILNLADSSARSGSYSALGDSARALGIALHTVEARTPEEVERAIDAARKLRVSGINVLASPFLYAERARIIKQGANARIPVMFHWPEIAEEGGLMAYGPRLTEIFRVLADYAYRILQGTSPADLPIQQPTKFELVINMKTARALGVKIPQSLLLRADHVIE